MTTTVPTRRRGRRSATKLGAAATTLGMIATVGITANASAATLHPNGSSVTIKVAVVSNGNMEELEALTPIFEKENPGINIEYDTLPENSERQLVETDVTTHANEFNVVMISNYETPIWAKNGWLANLSAYTATDPGYDVSDLVAAATLGPLGRRQAVLGAVLRRVVDGVLPDRLVQGGRPHDARAPDLGPGSLFRPEAEQPGQGRRRVYACGASRAGARTWLPWTP